MKYFYFLVYIAFCSVNLAISSTVSACIQPTIIVTNTDDNKDVEVVGSLRYAIANSCDGGTTTIDFDPSLANQTILLETELTIDKDINIVNTKAKFLQISGGGSKRIFYVTKMGGLELENVTIANGNAVDGGSIYIEKPDTITNRPVEIRKSTFLNNIVTGNGGAIYIIGDSIQMRAMTITNSTFINNQAKGVSSKGGAIYGDDNSIIEIINSTIYKNLATNGGGIAASPAAALPDDSILIVKNTIIANNAGGDCFREATLPATPLADDINNLFSDNSCDHTHLPPISLIDANLVLSLQNNGGFTKTLALSEDPRSPAINAGDPDTCVTEDQRGFPRNSSSDSPCDIGAFEATCEAQQQIPPEECRALINFYDKTNGPNWNDNNGWKVTPEPCSWIGVSCGDGYVTGIIRESKNLLGNLPDLSILKFLTTLNLKGNQLNGKIPSNLNNLTNLEYLYLHNNRFSGPIPDISKLNNLTELLLQNNQLDGEIPPSLVQLANLTRLDLSYNKLIVDSTQVALKELIRTKNPDGLNTQTIHPLNVAATALSPTQIKVTWDLIPYTGDDGYYLVKCDMTSGNPNRSIQIQTANKSANSITIDNLSANTTYYCVVETYTPNHGEQQNKLTSLESPEIEATTLTSVQPPDPPPPDDPVIPSEDTNLDLGSSVIGKSIQGNFNILRNKAIEIVDFQLSGDKEDFDILSPDFPITVNSGQGLNLKVQCIPSNPGLHTTLLQFIPKDSGQTIPQYSLKCTGKQPARYISSPAPNSTIVIGNGLINQTLTQTFSIRAGGEEDLQVYSYTLTGAEANYFAVTAPVFPITIADGSPEKVVTVTCTPPGVENYTAILQLSSNDPTQSTPTYTLKCKGKLPETTDFISTPLPEQTIDFGTSLVGKPVTFTLEIANEGNLDLVIEAIDLIDNDTESFEVLNSQLPITLSQIQNEQIITLQCLPTIVGIQTATLHLETNDPDNLTVNYPLICDGLSQSVGFTSTPLPGSELDLGSSPIGKAVTLDLSVTKTGNLPLKVSLVAITGAQADSFQITKPQLPILLADDTSTLENETGITVQCIPTQVGIHTAKLELQTNDPTISSPTYTLQCQGTTVVPIYNSIPIPYQSLDIGSSEIGQPLTTSLTILQQGTAALEVSSSQITGESAANFQIIQGTAPFSLLESNSEQNLLIQCLPQQLGPLTARLTLETNAPEYLTVYYDLTCTGLPAVNPPSPQIVLSYDRVYEDSPGGTLIGILSTLNSASPTHYYTLVDDANGLFVVQNDELYLVTTAQLDFETIPRYTIIVRSTDDQGVFLEQTFTIYVNDVSETQFLGKIVTESGTIGKQVTIDAAEKIKVIGYINPGQKQLGQLADLIMTYHWTPHEGGPPLIVPVTVAQQIQLKPNMEITLFEGRLIGLAGLFEVSLGYRLTNGQNLSAPIATLEVRPNRPPTQIQLSNRIIAENTPPDTVIGWFTTTDPDQKDYFRYGLIENQSTGYFKIVDNQLRTNNFRLDYESGTDYPITIRSVDSGGAYIDESFVIQVTDQEVSVVNLYLTRNSITENSSSGTLVGRLWTDGDEPGTYTYEIVKTPGPFILDGDLLLIAQDVPLDFETQPFYSVAVRSQQSETGQSIEQIFTINVINDVDIAYSGEISSLTTGQRLEPNLIQATDNIMVKIQLFPDQTHYGQMAELFSVALWQALDGTQSMTYMLANNTWKEWDGNLNNLASIQSLTLPEHHELMLWQGQLNSFSGGEFSVFIGYRLMTGELIYNRLNPFKISVQ
jgi:predicted outer membrane repeat protein